MDGHGGRSERHAEQIDALEHEALQVNDDMGLALDQQLNILKAYEERAQAQLVSVMADTQKAVGGGREELGGDRGQDQGGVRADH